MRKLSTREYVLMALLTAVAVLLLYLRPDSGVGSAGSGDPGEDLKLGDAPVVNLARLAGHIDAYDAEGRNLFQYYTPPPPRVAERPAPPPPKRIEPPPTPVIQTNRPPPTPSGPTPPPINFTYLGFLGPKENKIAVFEDGQDLLLARAGEVVKQQFRVLDFGYETVVMGYTDERFANQTQELPQKAAGTSSARSRGRR